MSEPDGTQGAGSSEGLDVSDGHLARLASGGNGQAFDVLLERHHGSIHRLCWSVLGDRPDADDATQETFVRAYQSLGRYDATRAFSPWLRGIAAKVCLQSLRRRSRNTQRQTSLEAEFVEPAAPDAAETSRLAEEAVLALSRLEETYRLPLAMFYLEDASVAEMAEALDITPGAARVRLHRGREKLREMLIDGSGDDDGKD